MINIIQNEELYEIRFPYDIGIIELVKNVPGRMWNPEAKMWTIPKNRLGFLINQIKGTKYEPMLNIVSDEQINENAEISNTTVIPDIDISNVPFYVKEGAKPYQHQLDFMKWAIDRQNKGNMHGFILADDMGCIAGDAIVEVTSDSQTGSMQLQEFYHYFSSHKNTHFKVKCLQNQICRYHDVIDVVYSGYKPVYELVLQDGHSVKVTDDHFILTTRGWISLHNLKEHDIVITNISNTHTKSESAIKTINVVGSAHVYDIKMADPYHNFIANGIVVHNCGKSIESTNLALYNKTRNYFKHCLIICCINSSKYNWQDDIKQHTRGAEIPYILGSRLRRDGTVRYDGGEAKYADLVSGYMYNDESQPEIPYFMILNVEALRYRVGKVYPVARRLAELINAGEINMIILDEVHRNLSPSSQQGKQILAVKKSTGSKAMWVPMTGTPITKQPTDVFTPLKLCDGHDFTSFYKWCEAFCIYGGFGGHEIIGYKNIQVLKGLLESNMIRRSKDDVLDLPPKIKYTEYVENTEYQKKLYKKVVGELIEQAEEIQTSLNPMTRFLKLRQVNGSPELVDDTLSSDDPQYIKKNAKLQRLMELLEDIHARGEKVVVFSNWVEPLRTLYKFVSKKYKTCVFTGTMSPEDREKHKRVFQTDPKYTVLLGTIGAAGTSHTFTAARNAIFFDSPWNPSDKEQASDRIYRIGTTQSVNIFTLVTKDTVDDKVEQILYTKEGISKYIVDGKLDLRKNPELFDFLLSDSKPSNSYI